MGKWMIWATSPNPTSPILIFVIKMLLLSAFTIVLPYFSVFMMSLATVYLIVKEEARMGLSVEPSCQRGRTDSKVWIMVLSLGLFAFTGSIMLFPPTSFSNFCPQKKMIDRQHTLKALTHRPHRLSPGWPNQRLQQWRSVRETGSTGPHVPARGAWCTRGALKSSSAFPRPSGNRPVGALSRLTTQQSLSGTSCADSPDRRVTHPWYRAVREGHVLVQAHPK